MTLCIGLMSGTSADGMDACLVDITPDKVTMVDALCIDYPDEVSDFFKALAISGTLSAELIMDADRLIAQYGVQAVVTLLEKNTLSSTDISLIGSHGHTLRHRPQPDGFSWQIGDPSWLAEYTGITCVADFRRRDIAAGGEGAPLVPAFHQVAMQAHQPCGVLNIGGIANLTLVNPDPNKTLGFDTGPGNALMDEYCKAMTGCSCDAEGTSAARGTIISELLEQWLQHPYFSEEPPKSTGRELFNLKQLQIPEQYPADNVLATLAELTATSISSAIKRYAPELQDLYVCGGGLKNSHLMNRIRANLPQMNVQSTEAAGVHPDWMEAIAFAWLGWRTLNHLSGNLPAVTGAQGERILGGIYPASTGKNNQK